HAPDEVLRTFGSRLSRAVPLDELLLQMVESLRKTLALQAAEVWTGSNGLLERTVSVPELGAARVTLNASEEPEVARAGVSAPASSPRPTRPGARSSATCTTGPSSTSSPSR